MCRTENEKGGGGNSAERRKGGDMGSCGEGGVDDFMYRGGTGSGGSCVSPPVPLPFFTPFWFPSQTLTSGGK